MCVERWILSLVALVLALWAVPACDTGEAPSHKTFRGAVGTMAQSLIGGKPDRSLPAVGGLARSKSGGTFCTASLISTRVVLTAGHCIGTRKYNSTDGSPFFRIEVPDTSSSKGYRFVYYDAELIAPHPNWSGNVNAPGGTPPNGLADIAVVILKNKVDPKDAIPLPYNRNNKPDSSWIGKDLWFLGYGKLNNGYPSVKHGAMIPISGVQPDRIVHRGNGLSICFGDSGGPPLMQFNGQWHVMGANSYVTNNCYGSGASTDAYGYSAFIEGYLKQYGSERSCNSDADCDACFVCDATTKVCQRQAVQQNPKSCKPCNSDADCSGGTCLQVDGVWRCVQSCSANKCCPSGDVCDVSGATQVCLPSSKRCPDALCSSHADCGKGEACGAGLCGKACTTDTDCLAGQTCVGGACRTPKPGQVGETCANGRPCEQGLRCYAFSGKSICSRACGPSTSIGAGSPGSACRADQTCDFDTTCIPLQSGGGGICLKKCSAVTDCLAGMVCNNIRTSQSQYCHCKSDAECKSEEVCNKDLLGEFGACAPKGTACDPGLECKDIGNRISICLLKTNGNPCGDGQCEASRGENCQTCPADCACPPGQICQGGSCASSSSCGNNVCEASRGEHCANCPQDCGCQVGFVCQNDKCEPTVRCGNGRCESSNGENCLTCLQDCACPSGKLCKGGACEDASHCGNGQCESVQGENCATCPGDCSCPLTHQCYGGVCIPESSCGNGQCEADKGENCETCAVDCACQSPLVCRLSQCVDPSGCTKDADCPPAYRCLQGQCRPPTPGGQTDAGPPEQSQPEPPPPPPDQPVNPPPPEQPVNPPPPPDQPVNPPPPDQATNPTGRLGQVCRPDGSCEFGLFCLLPPGQAISGQTLRCYPKTSDGRACPLSQSLVQCDATGNQCRAFCLQLRGSGCSSGEQPSTASWLWLLLVLLPLCWRRHATR